MLGYLQRGSFLRGLACGALLGCASMLMPVIGLGSNGTLSLFGEALRCIDLLWAAVNANLRGSLAPFCLILLCYCLQLKKVRGLLAASEPQLESVVRHEQLLDLCASLFFGVGVIWTAIGMRDALLHALGDPAGTTAQGALAVLQRLVDGGILLALSTTIVGGIGGYLMRSVKSLTLGRGLSALYIRASQQVAVEGLTTLRRIEQRLESAHDGSATARSG